MNIKKESLKKGAEVGARTAGDIVAIVFKILGTILLIGLLTTVFLAIIFASYVKNYLSAQLDVNLSDFSLSQTSIVYCYDDDVGDYVQLDELSGRQRRTWVDYEKIPKYMEYAAVAIEDKRFYQHHGVDWFRTLHAVGNMFLSMSDTFGGSTITQQLIKNLTTYDDVTVKRKITEIFRALDFEKRYTKQEIIEWYLNSIYLGEGCYGIAAAANEYFGKDVSELSILECASIISITNNPSMYDPYIAPKSNKRRREIVLQRMLEDDYITSAQYKEAMSQELVLKRGAEDEETNGKVTSWFIDALIEDVIHDLMREKNVSYNIAEQLLYTAGYRIYTTLDPDIQAIVDDVYSSRDNIPSGYKQSTYQEMQSAIVIIDPYTGDIVALSGGVGKKEGSRLFNLATDMKRSPGSSIKPIASYAQAIELGLIMPYSLVYDSADVKLQGSDWYPNNDDYSNAGQITIRYALQRSINTVAAQLIDRITPETSFYFLRDKLGFTELIESENGMSDINYASLALGQLTYGVSVRDMASAYTCFVNDGIYTKGRLYSKIEDANGNLIYENIPASNVAFSTTTAYYMNDMLQNVVNSGTGVNARLPNQPAAGKTGASGNWCDRWFVGYTPYYVGAVWCGYSQPEYMGSSNPSTGMWKKVMERVHAELEPKDFPIPEGMKKVTVCIDTGLLAGPACHNDIRGDRTMTLYMTPTAAPTQTCTCHTMVELCEASHGFPTDDCPADKIISCSVLDLSKAPSPIDTPPYYTDASLYKVDSEKATDAQREAMVRTRIYYTLDEITPCSVHQLDPISGWFIDTTTGYLINPSTGSIYDPVEDKLYDKYSGWQIDWKTGALIDPVSGGLIDPWTGEAFTKEIDPNAPDKVKRPPNYGPQTPEPTNTPVPDDEGLLLPPDLVYTPEPTDEPVIPTDEPSEPNEPTEPEYTPDDGGVFYTEPPVIPPEGLGDNFG